MDEDARITTLKRFINLLVPKCFVVDKEALSHDCLAIMDRIVKHETDQTDHVAIAEIFIDFLENRRKEKEEK